MVVAYGDEDYTDYSCSTPLERLSRDIETVLRTWHIDQGCDRHVSLAAAAAAAVAATAIDGHGIPPYPTTPTTTTTTTTTNNNNSTSLPPYDDPTCPLIRSTTLVWHVPLMTREGRSTVTIDLELALWDAPASGVDGGGLGELLPPMTSTNGGTMTRNGVDGSGSGNPWDSEPTSRLVHSLQRTAFGKMPAHDYLFDNFARLFGIGQHLSLSPIQPEPIPYDFIQAIGGNVLERHDDQLTAPFVMGSTLSGWLQHALNCATANCHCAIPAFGVWGVYRPNEILGSRHDNYFHHHQPNGLIKRSSSLVPGSTATTVVGDMSVISALSKPDLVGTTIRTGNSVDGGSIADGGFLPRPPPKGIPVFPQWARALQDMELPSVSRAYKRRAVHWNSHYVPPLVCGRVDGNLGAIPLDIPSVSATMWVSATKQLPGNYSKYHRGDSNDLYHALAASSRLSIWGSLLLEHCEEEEAMCVLEGARHVFGWFKVSPNEAPKNFLFGTSNAEFTATLQEWRLMNTALISTPKPGDSEFDLYRKHCQAYAMDLLEDAWNNDGNKSQRFNDTDIMDYYEYQQRRSHAPHSQPVWGPIDDPVASAYATTTWSGKATSEGVDEPLMTFPVRIQSARPVSKRDWMNMEEGVERAILDPLSPCRFVVQVYYDRDTSVARLAANQRCVLAALIRSATLPGETLLSHLTDTELVELWDDDAGTIVATKLANKSRCGSATTKIVQAMDWSSIMEDLISLREAQEIVHSVMRGELVSGFPTSPEECFLDADDVCRPFPKAAPFGRLLSLLFARMANLRALSSMSLVWSVFCQELRRRWDARESLPNMQYVPGLDPHPIQLYEKRSFTSIGHQASFAAFLNCTEPDPDDYHCLIGQKLQVFQICVECVVASELLEEEVMERFLEQGEIPSSAKVESPPGLIRSEDLSEEEDHKWKPVGSDKVTRLPDVQVTDQERLPGSRKHRKWPKSKAAAPKKEVNYGERQDYGPPTINSDLEFWVMDEPGYAPRDGEGVNFVQQVADHTGFDFVTPAPKDLEGVDDEESASYRRKRSMLATTIDLSAWEGTIMDENHIEDDGDDDSEGSGNSALSRTTSASLSQVYFDAAEAGSIFSMKHGFVTLDTVMNVADLKRRPGARCPVQQVTLSGTGDQLYAPYIQRPCPLTDDMVMERKFMLASEQREGELRKTVLESRLRLAHRFQQPKLISDMSAFKAANPSASLEDFTRWYGNPANPLDDYDELIPDDTTVTGAYYESAAKKLDRASEAMKVLVAVRDFWASSWEQAPAISAAEQKPLFDYTSTVEIAIDYLEQLHPASLLNQVIAVNLSSAYFALLTSAEDALNIGIVKSAMDTLRRKIDRALQLLSADATGALFQGNFHDSVSTVTSTANQYISEESIFACEEACNALSVSETMLARAVSLLSKFPCQYRLVQDLLKLTDGTTVGLADAMGRKGFLSAVYQQQQKHWESSGPRTHRVADGIPQPLLREYVLRNLDNDRPCQLAVRFGDAAAYLGRVDNDGGVLIAVTKSRTD